jgi:hypothetical protein
MVYHEHDIDAVDNSHQVDPILDDSHLFKIIKVDHFHPNCCDGGDNHDNHKHNNAL